MRNMLSSSFRFLLLSFSFIFNNPGKRGACRARTGTAEQGDDESTRRYFRGHCAELSKHASNLTIEEDG